MIDDQEKQMFGYIIVAIIESMTLILLQLLMDLAWKPLYIAAIELIIVFIGIALGWFVRHRFGLPNEEPGPIKIPELSIPEMELEDYTITVSDSSVPLTMPSEPVVEAATEEAIEEAIEDLDAKIEELKKEE